MSITRENTPGHRSDDSWDRHVGPGPAGAPTGRTTVLAGHVGSLTRGIGTLAALRDVAAGSQVVLTDIFGGRHAYQVTARRAYLKYALPRSVFTAAPAPRAHIGLR